MERKWKEYIPCCLNISMTLLVGVGVFLWWYFKHPEYLSFQEQYQMFLFNTRYFAERIAVAGGLADYLAEFLVQFYFHTATGALVVASLATLMMHTTRLVLKKYHADNTMASTWSILIPAVMLYDMGNQDYLLSLPVAVELILLGYLLLSWCKMGKIRFALSLILLPVGYWLTGPAIYILAGLTAMEYWKKKDWVKGAVPVVVFILSVYAIGTFFLKQYPWADIWWGINYNRFSTLITESVDGSLWHLPVAILSLVLLFTLLPQRKKMESTILRGIETVAFLAVIILVPPTNYDSDTYELIKQDYLIRNEQWNAVVQQAETYQPFLASDAVGVNLALSMTGQLGERMFEFYQPGLQGLITPYIRDYMTCMSSMETFYRLGLVNSALRYAYDIQESTGNNRKSSRLTKRLVECYLINGNYRIARKHINYLKQTLFYADWAKEAETCLNNEGAINKHPVWGKIRNFRFTHDFFYNIQEIDKIFGLLYLQNHANTMAQDYFYVSMLINRNLSAFYTYLPEYAETHNGYLPVNFQEALCMIWANSHPDLNNMPVRVYEEVKHSMMTFSQRYRQNPKDKSLLYGELGKTYWSYYFLKNHAEDANPDGNTSATRIAH